MTSSCFTVSSWIRWSQISERSKSVVRCTCAGRRRVKRRVAQLPTFQLPSFSCSHTSSQSPDVRRIGELVGDVSANTGICPDRGRLGSEAANHLLDGLTCQFEPFSRANPVTTGLSECLFKHGSAHSCEDLKVGH